MHSEISYTGSRNNIKCLKVDVLVNCAHKSSSYKSENKNSPHHKEKSIRVVMKDYFVFFFCFGKN